MTAMISTPRLDLIARLIDADLEVVGHLERLRGLERRLGGARRHLAGADAVPPVGGASLRRVEGEYGEALDQIRAARRKAQALCLAD